MTVVRILLACSAGMSTSLLVSKMKEAAESKGMDAEIWAVAQDKAFVDMERADVLLIGPQMRFMKRKYEEKAKDSGIPVDTIDPVSYGRVDGKAVLEKALNLIKK